MLYFDVLFTLLWLFLFDFLFFFFFPLCLHFISTYYVTSLTCFRPSCFVFLLFHRAPYILLSFIAFLSFPLYPPLPSPAHRLSDLLLPLSVASLHICCFSQSTCFPSLVCLQGPLSSCSLSSLSHPISFSARIVRFSLSLFLPPSPSLSTIEEHWPFICSLVYFILCFPSILTLISLSFSSFLLILALHWPLYRLLSLIMTLHSGSLYFSCVLALSWPSSHIFSPSFWFS